MYKLVKNYKEDRQLRQSFNQLATQTFGLTFEDWYQNGYWRNHYIPYSMVEDEQVVANVSVNPMEFLFQGELSHVIQLGTVMSDPSVRNQGLIRRIMEEIERDYGEQTEGMFLFANDRVLDFYPKFGFRPSVEYQYSKTVSIQEQQTILPYSMKEKESWDCLEMAIQTNQFHGGYDMIGNSELIMFYATKFMTENIYYDKITQTYVIAEINQNQLILYGVYSKQDIELEQVIKLFGSTIKQVVLEFVPKNPCGYQVTKLQKEDTTLYVKGKIVDTFSTYKLCFPALSHA